MDYPRWSPRALARLGLAVILAVALLTGFQPERLGDRYQVALPLMGLACATVSGSAPEYLLRYAVLWTGIRAGKNGLGRHPVNIRPRGGDGGMPSGHTASASFGASALVHGCFAASPPAQMAAVVAAGFTGASRMDAGKHTIWQVLAGALWALLCDRALRAASPRRDRLACALRRMGAGLAASVRWAARAVRCRAARMRAWARP